MKANAPKKIYIHVRANKELGTTWHGTWIGVHDIEYIHKDAFIEKACEWLKNHYRDYMHNPTGERLEAFFGGDMCNDFEDYMKGE